MKTERQDLVLLAFVTVIGLFIRLSPAASSSFPLNDGGLFYKMILDLQGNHFLLPNFTSYNNAQLPFAYPPLAFYLYALTSEISGIPVIKLMQFLPAIVSGLTIPAFYLLAREFLDEKLQIMLSVFTFAFIPRAFEWLIMGGGVTRSLGFLFAILAIRQYILLATTSSTRHLFLTALLVGFAVSTHPETPIQLVISLVLIYLWKNRTWEGLKQFAIVWAGALLISAPWWLTVLLKHGTDPFFAALTSSSQDSYNLIARIFILFRFNFTDEPYLTLISCLGLIGLFAMLAKRKTILPIWFCLIQMIEPRGGGLYMMLPLSMFTGFALDQVILPILRTPDTDARSYSRLSPNLEKTFLSLIFLYGMLSAMIVTTKISRELTLRPSDLTAFNWIKDHTPASSRFILITQANPLNDASSEWFPVLAERTSLVTSFGREWINDGSFSEYTKNYRSLQKCMLQGMTCLNEWMAEADLDFSHIYLRKTQPTSSNPTILSEELGKSTEYRVLYETNEVEIFEKK